MDEASGASLPCAAPQDSQATSARCPPTTCEAVISASRDLDSIPCKTANCNKSREAEEAAEEATIAELELCARGGAHSGGAPAKQEPPQCFVCMADIDRLPVRRTACACVDLHIHDACLLELVSRSKAADKTMCTVCLQPYRNVQQRQVATRHFNPMMVDYVVFFTFGSIMFGYCVMWALVATPDEFIHGSHVAAALLGGCGALTMAASCAFMCLAKRRGVPMLVRQTRITGVAVRPWVTV